VTSHTFTTGKPLRDNMYNMPFLGARPTTLSLKIIVHLLFPNKHSYPSSFNKDTEIRFLYNDGTERTLFKSKVKPS
jgi:hypothetical protein